MAKFYNGKGFSVNSFDIINEVTHYGIICNGKKLDVKFPTKDMAQKAIFNIAKLIK